MHSSRVLESMVVVQKHQCSDSGKGVEEGHVGERSPWVAS